jgi:hypothetical protein
MPRMRQQPERRIMTDIIRRPEDFLPDWENSAMLPTTTQRNQADRMRDWVELFKEVYKAAEVLSKTNFVPKEMIGNTANVAAAIMKGFELGIDPLDALASMYVIHGRVGMYAEFQRRRIIQAGHIFRIVESTDTRCIVEGTRRDTNETHRANFTVEAARKAGIDLGKYPNEKLIARATSRLCKQAFPDVLSGTLIAEDLIDGVIPTDTEPPPTPELTAPPVQRRRPTKPAKAARTQPKPTPTTEPDDELAELLGDTPREPAASAATTDSPPDAAPKTTYEEEGGERPTPTRNDVGQPPPQSLIDITPPDEPITKPQSRKLHALFHQLDVNDRNDRLIITTHILGYHITSSAQLTKNEANRLIDTIESWFLTAEYNAEDRVNDILNQAAINRVNDILNQAAINQTEVNETGDD